MNKLFTLIILSLLFVTGIKAQFKDIKISDRDLSSYQPSVEQGVLSNNKNYKPGASVEYHTIGAMHKNQFSGSLQAEFSGDRPVLISGMIKDVDTRDINNAMYNYLLEAKKIMGINDPINEFVETKTSIDEQGNRHIRMQQVYRGIPIFGKEVILHEERNHITSLNGLFAATPESINTTPTINIEENRELVKTDIGSPIKDIDRSVPGHKNLEQWTQELVILPSEDDAVFTLAYHNTVYTDIITRIEYFVDAHTGKVIDKYESLCKLHNHEAFSHDIKTIDTNEDVDIDNHQDVVEGGETAQATDLFGNTVTINTWEQGGTYYLLDASRNMFVSTSNMPDEPRGAIWTIDAFNTSPQNESSFNYDHVKSNNNGWSSHKGAVSAHFNGGKAFLYYKNVHARNSIDGKGGNIISLVNISDENGNSMGNAFWNGQAMFYGNGDANFKPLARALDVAGHELTHGVVQNTANLVYQGEAGAINESMADIFGAMIDRDDWRIGEDVVKTGVFTSGALRSLEDPHNGQSAGDYGHGYQPRHVSEKYTGSQDNGGVHLNSGIPNYAFYLFATNSSVGKVKAEKVYYRALSQYLTKNSQFVDLRIAVVKAAGDLYNEAVVNAAKNAFESVGIGEGAGGDYETDYESNPGQEWLLVVDEAKTKTILLDKDKVVWADPFSSVAPISKPSVSDNGEDIVYVGVDKKIHLIKVNWGTGQYSDIVFEDQPIWRNVVVNKAGTKLAALKDDKTNKIEIYDDGVGEWNTFTLTNPTYTEGVSTGDVKFADAMEFDPTGEWLMYDAKSEISGSGGVSISYWDIGFARIWDNANNLWGDGKIEKLFSSLPEDVSVGNPVYSKNSGYIIAFDYIEVEDNKIVGVNTETNKMGSIATDLFALGYPNYSANDKKMIYDLDLISFVDLGVLDLKNDKISNVQTSERVYKESARWGVFFSDGERNLAAEDLASPEELSMNILPNPITSSINISLESKWTGSSNISIMDINGRIILSEERIIVKGQNSISIDGSSLGAGTYIIQLKMEEGMINQKIMKLN